MIMVFLNWLYIGITSFLTGYAVLSLFTRFFPYKISYRISYCLAGLATLTVYAQIYSLFAGVSMYANPLLCLICIVITFVWKKEIGAFFAEWFTEIRQKKGLWIVYGLLATLFLFGTSRGYMHFDTGLYHAQSIRWIEEYGVVPGLGNLHIRFAYNSASFALNALYSMKWIFGQSMHTTAGFLAFLSACLTLDLYKIVTEKRIKVSDFCRIALVYYLASIFGEMVSPASDYYAQLLILDVLILWTTLDEKYEKEQKTKVEPYALCCILLVYALSIKFSIGFLLLLVIKPAVMLIKKKDIKQIITCLVTGIVVIAPFMIRNYVISGWLIYPSTFPDLFNPDWKIPKGQAQYDAHEIAAYGKGLNDAAKWDTPFMDWIGVWFRQLKTIEKMWVFLSAAALLFGLMYIIVKLIRNGKQKMEMNFILVFAVMSISALFWFLQAPLIRYGYAYITLLPMITFGYFYNWVQSDVLSNDKMKKWIFRLSGFVLLLFLLFNVKVIGNSIITSYSQPYYITQEDYIDGEATTYEIDGIIIYVPVTQGQIGYNKFPSSPVIQNIELRGATIKEGFRTKKEK